MVISMRLRIISTQHPIHMRLDSWRRMGLTHSHHAQSSIIVTNFSPMHGQHTILCINPHVRESLWCPCRDILFSISFFFFLFFLLFVSFISISCIRGYIQCISCCHADIHSHIVTLLLFFSLKIELMKRIRELNGNFTEWITPYVLTKTSLLINNAEIKGYFLKIIIDLGLI